MRGLDPPDIVLFIYYSLRVRKVFKFLVHGPNKAYDQIFKNWYAVPLNKATFLYLHLQTWQAKKRMKERLTCANEGASQFVCFRVKGIKQTQRLRIQLGGEGI